MKEEKAAAAKAETAKAGTELRKRRQWVVVSYDIADDRRRLKIMKTLAGYGKWVQYSVFECELRPGDLEKLTARLQQLSQREEDDIRFYPLCESCLGKVTTLGKAQLHRHEEFRVV